MFSGKRGLKKFVVGAVVLLIALSIVRDVSAALLPYHWHSENAIWARHSSWPSGSGWVNASDNAASTWNGLSDFQYSYDTWQTSVEVSVQYFHFSGDQIKLAWKNATNP